MAGLATRCAACGTVFRVVPDQLRVAGGFVRCGRCSEVFNAAEALIELEAPAAPLQAQPRQETPPVAASPAFETAETNTRLAPEAQAAEAPVDASEPALDFGIAPPQDTTDPALPEPGTVFDLQLLPEPEPAIRPEAETGSGPVIEPAAEAPGMAKTPDRLAEPLFDLPPSQPQSGEPALGVEALIDRTGAPSEAAQPDDPRAEPEDQPSFLRSAERAENRRSPRRRGALVALCVVGALALLLQAVFTYRDQVVARFPGSRVLIEPMCAQVLGCRIEAARSIESLAVESSGLVRVEKSSVYKLQVALRNRSAVGVAVPALELTLSDSQGKPIARRVLRAAELGVNQTTVAAGRELALQATLQTATDPVAGYAIELFYP